MKSPKPFSVFRRMSMTCDRKNYDLNQDGSEKSLAGTNVQRAINKSNSLCDGLPID